MNPQTPEDVEQSPRGDVTQLLLDWNNGDPSARDRLMTIVYNDLHRMAHQQLLYERRRNTMHTGTLAHEVYMRLFKANDIPCRNREEFFGIVARQMRQVLVDAARKRGYKKRGANPRHEQLHELLEDATVAVPARDLDLIALDEALEDLAQFDEELIKVVELRFFAGHTIEETAEILGVATDTVKRRWHKAKIYLYDLLKDVEGAGDGSKKMETD